MFLCLYWHADTNFIPPLPTTTSTHPPLPPEVSTSPDTPTTDTPTTDTPNTDTPTTDTPNTIITATNINPTQQGFSKLATPYLTLMTTVKTFRLLQPCFGHLSCIPFVWVTRKVQGMRKGLVEKPPSFIKLVSPFRKHINHHFWWGLLFHSLIYKSAPGGVPWLHSCGSNAWKVAK